MRKIKFKNLNIRKYTNRIVKDLIKLINLKKDNLRIKNIKMRFIIIDIHLIKEKLKNKNTIVTKMIQISINKI